MMGRQTQKFQLSAGNARTRRQLTPWPSFSCFSSELELMKFALEDERSRKIWAHRKQDTWTLVEPTFQPPPSLEDLCWEAVHPCF